MPSQYSSNHEGYALGAITSLFLALGIIAVILRCYVRIVIAKSFGQDDYFIVFTLSLLIAGDVCIYNMLSIGVGRHLDSLPEPEISVLAILKWNTIYQVINVIGAFFTKLSIALFILRLKNTKKLRLSVWLILTPLGLSTVVLCFIVLLQCIPLAGLWTPTLSSRCISAEIPLQTSYVQSGFAIITDIVLTASPIAILWKVRMTRRKKVAICGLMSLGLIATIANALRNAFIPDLVASDLSYTMVPIVLVADLEFSIGVIAACIPTIMPLFNSDKAKKSKTYEKMYGAKPRTVGSYGGKFRKAAKVTDIELRYPYSVTVTDATISQKESQVSDAELPLKSTGIEENPGLQIPISTTWKVESEHGLV
ncbi:hypothetical protein EAF04_002887 [Stromatinia cepivora]|nr:hypothetical protein EAF04_002887 [Stromatinia cepivora]